MKSLNISVAVLIVLLAFSFHIGRKEFHRHDSIQTIQSGKNEFNRKSASDSILKMMPACKGLPAPKPEPVVTNSFTEITYENESDETKTTVKETFKKEAHEEIKETKSVAEPTEADKSAPVAIPVLSPEEAIKVNQEAIAFQQKHRIAKASEEPHTESKEAESLAETTEADRPAPVTVPVLSPEEAIKLNQEAVRFQQKYRTAKAFRAFSHKIEHYSNKIHFVLSLLPLLFIADILLIKKKKNRKKNSKVFEYFSLSRRMRILFSVSLLAFGILVFVPWSVYFGNSPQFPFIFQDFVNWNLRVLTISTIGACIALLLVPPKISDYLVALIAGLGLCVYLQAMFMNQHLGTMNGAEPEWSEHRIFGIFNLVIWIVLVLLPIVLKKMIPSFFSKVISMTAGSILLLEIIATTSMVFSANQSVWLRSDTYFTDGSKQFQLSKEKNVVVFIFDTLGSEFIKLCFESYPEEKDVVKDFIWYEDARSNYKVTFPGLSHELTGAFFPVPANSFYGLFEGMWHSRSAKSFYKQMSDAGYDARLYCRTDKFLIGPEEYYHDYFSNIEARDIIYEINYDRLHSCLRQMSGFSSAPFLSKKYFFYAFDFCDGVVQKQVADISSEKRWIPKTNPEFLNKMISSGITSDAPKPTLSFYYTTGVHIPWYIDEKCKTTKTPFDNPIPTTRSCFYILSEFIRLLKKENIYDNTAILVCSDHGGNLNNISTPYDMSFMIKPFHKNQSELLIDDSKVQSIDILPTLLKMARGEKAELTDFDGYPSFDIPDERTRSVYLIVHAKEFPTPKDPDYEQLVEQVLGAASNCLEEYNYVDAKSFSFGVSSQSFVRRIPLIKSSK